MCGNVCSFVVIGGNVLSLVAMCDHLRVLVDIVGRWFFIGGGNWWSFVVISGHCWSLLVIAGVKESEKHPPPHHTLSRFPKGGSTNYTLQLAISPPTPVSHACRICITVLLPSFPLHRNLLPGQSTLHHHPEHCVFSSAGIMIRYLTQSHYPDRDQCNTQLRIGHLHINQCFSNSISVISWW